MKICFFDRLNLTQMYGAMDNALSNKYDIVHVAYSEDEYNVLVNKFNIPIKRTILFKNRLRKYLSKDYSGFDYNDLDERIHNATEGRFNINLSIQVDRALKYKTYEESLKLFAALYLFWNAYFEIEKPDVVVHEMTSLSINHICAVVEKEKDILYINEIQVPGLYETNLIFGNYWGGSSLFNNNNIEITEKVKKYIFDFQNKKQETLLGNISMYKMHHALHFFSQAFKRKIYIFFNKNKYPALEDYIENYLIRDTSIIDKFQNLKKYSKIKWDIFDKNINYYYYPLHLEPEAAVYYWGDGIYENQIKLIENIASSLPPNTFLYVKDHPHNFGYRSFFDYIKLKQINNIRLLNVKESSYELIKYSKGVITILGSAGFEALLLDKPVYYFGHPYYEFFNNTYKIKNIRDLRAVLNEPVCIKSNIENFVKFYSNTYEGNAALFYSENYEGDINLKNVINAFDNYFQSINK